jgi:quinol monooxygenase YgiN
MHRCARLILAALFFAMFAAVAPAAQAQPAPTQTPPAAQAQPGDAYYVVTYFETGIDALKPVAALLRQYSEDGRKEPGNLRLEALHQVGRPGHFALLQAWTDKAAADKHAAAEPAKKLRRDLQPLLTAPFDERVHTALSAAALQVEAGGRALYVLTHVDIVPSKKDDGVAATIALAEPGRQERGNLGFDVLQQAERANHLTVVEIWKSYRYQRDHAGTDPIKAYRSKLTPMLGALYDERLFLPIGEPRQR